MKIYRQYVKFGLLGLGRVVKSRVSSVFKNEINYSKVVAVYDKNKHKNEKFTKFFKVPKTNSLRELLRKELDFIYLSTESGNHAKHIKKCFDANKNVIVEKPPTLRVDQLIKLEDIAKNKRLLFYVVFQNRLNKSVAHVKKILKKTTKKKIIFVNLKLLWCRKQNYYNDWHGKWFYDGGVIAQQGVHYIDLLCHLFGKPIKCVSVLERKSSNLQAEDTHVGIISFPNNIHCQVSLTTALRPNDIGASIEIMTWRTKIKLYGLCCNKIKISNNDLKKNKRYDFISKELSENVPNVYGLSHFRVLQIIINHTLNNKKKPRPLKAIDTIDTLKLIHMMYKSYEKKRWVYLSENSFKSKLGY